LLEGFVPPVIPESDRALYEKSGWGRRIGFGKKVAVLVVDMTRMFVEDSFPLGCSKTGRPAAQAISKLLDSAKQNGVPIIFTKPSSAKEFSITIQKIREEKLAALDVEGANEIVEPIMPSAGDIVIEKAKPSGFIGTPLLGVLTYFNVDTIIVTGMVTSGCVRATVVDGFSYNFRVIIPIECVADRGDVPHNVNLFDMDMKYADVMPLSEVLDNLAKLQSSD
jgi:nicotinamidase-related amidase